MDIDIIFDMPISKLNGWKAYYKLRDELSDEAKEDYEREAKSEKAKLASKKGGWD